MVEPIGLDAQRPALAWRLRGEGAEGTQVAWQVCVSTEASCATANGWDSGRVESGVSVGIRYGGRPLASRETVYWRVRVWTVAGGSEPGPWSAVSHWEMGLAAADWTAQWIGRRGVVMPGWRAPVLPTPHFRKRFSCPGGIRRARLYASGLGYAEYYLNGRRVDDRVLDPVVTAYDRRVRYVTLDVADLLTPGENVIGAILGNGWYNAHTAEVWHFDKASWRDYPKLLLQLEVETGDGQRVTLCSDSSWAVTDGPIRFDGLRNGETYDARAELGDWSSPGFDADAWKPTAVTAEPGGRLCAQYMPPCRVVATIAPVAVLPTPSGDRVYDLGQSITGWGRLRVSGPAGRELVLKYAERLAADGDLDASSIDRFILAGDCQTDRYVLKGDGVETWEPRFSYHGFRYVRIQGLDAGTEVASLEGRVVNTAFDEIGTFSASDPVLNQLQRFTRASFLGNFTGIPTDCPHREKNGWTGDAQLAAETGLWNFDCTNAYRQWIESMADAQRPSGQLPGIVPTTGWGFNWGSGPAWDVAFLLIPWYLWLYAGDTSAIEAHYEGMQRYVAYCARRSPEGIADFGLGDWCHPDQKRMAPAALTATGYYYCMCRLLVRFAGLLGREEDAVRYTDLAARVRESFNRTFYRGDGVYGAGEQTALACALHHGLADARAAPRVVERLVEAVEARACRADFGILGAKYVLRALAEHGHTDLALRILTQPEFPGWAHWLKQGATTLWETWDGESSRNHIMFGDISAWMIQHLAGIAPDPDAPGFKHFHIRPAFVESLDEVTATHHSPYGTIRSAWQRAADGIRLEVEVPPNTTAQVQLPEQNVTVAPGMHAWMV